MTLPLRVLRQELDKQRSDGARVAFADVVSITPVEVTYDQGESSVPAYVAPGVATVIGARVAVLKHGNAPGIVLGINTNEPSGVTGDWIAADTITAVNLKAGIITAREIAANVIEAKHIKAGTITATEIAAGSITTELLAAESVIAGKIKAGTITATQIAASTITAGQIAAGTITATQIKAGTITATEIKAGSITTVELAANTIEAGDIKAETITATEIASATITSGKIASGTIVGGNIASGTITASKITISELSALSADLGTITAGTVTGATLRTAASGKRVVIDAEGLHAFNAVETVLDFNTTTGNLKIKGAIEAGSTIPASTITGQLTNAQLEAIAAAKITGTITETQIGAESVSTGKIKASAITSALIAANTIVAGDIAAGTITATEIATDAIEAKHIKAEAVESSEIKANTIVAGDIAASTITATQIASETITGAKIAAATIVAANLAANSIEAGQIKAGAVTATKLSVSELSAIAANLGTITAGSITGATFATAESGLLLNSEGINILRGSSETVNKRQALKFLSSLPSGEVNALLKAWQVGGSINSVRLAANWVGEEAWSGIDINASKSASGSGSASVVARASGKAGTRIRAIITDEEQSDFLQLTGIGRRKVNFGTVTLVWNGAGSASNTAEVEHGLQSTPLAVYLQLDSLLTVAGNAMHFTFGVERKSSSIFKVNATLPTGSIPSAGSTVTFTWIAFG